MSGRRFLASILLILVGAGLALEAAATVFLDRAAPRVTLAPGQETALHLPADARLVLRRPGGGLEPEDIVLAVSDGSGLLVFRQAERLPDGGLTLAPSSETAVVRVGRAGGRASPITVDLLVARSEPPPEPPVPARRLDLEAPDVTVKGRWGAPRGYDAVVPETPAMLRVTGPARLVVETRLRLDGVAAGDDHFYRVEARLNGRLWQSLETEGVIDWDASGDGAGLLARMEEGGIDVPAGEHRLVLAASRPVLLHLSRQDEPGYLLPGLNRPPVPPEAAPSGRSLWDISPADLARLDDPAVSDTLAPATLKRRAHRLARDNRWPGGGLAAAELLERAAARRGGDPDLERAARRLRGAYTFRRDLLPVDVEPETEQRFGWVADRPLLPPGAAAPSELPAAAGADAPLDRLASGYFLPLPAPGRPFLYALPEREAPSELRLLAARGATAADFFVRFDEAEPVRLRLLSAPDLPGDRYGPSLGLAGLARLGENHGLDPAAPLTLSGPFALRRTPAPLMDAATVALPLPKAVRQVRLWRADADGPPPLVAVQVRVASPSRLSGLAYRAEVRHLGRDNARALFTQAVERAIACPRAADLCLPSGPDSVTARELLNDWVPLLRLLRSRHRTVWDAIAPLALEVPGAAPLSLADQERLRAAAEELARDGQPLAAVEVWSRLVQGTTGTDWRDAQLGRIGALRRQGETFLADRLLKGLYLAIDDPRLRRPVYRRLIDLYRQADDRDALVGLLVADLDRTEDLSALAEVLLAEGLDAMALQVGLLLPPEARPSDLPQAAYRLGQGALLDALAGEEGVPDRRAYWRGLMAQALGRYDGAVASLGPVWGEALRRGLAVRAGLPGTAPDWLSWWQSHPGPWLTEDAAPFVTGHAGTASLIAVERDLPARAFRAEPGLPVRLPVVGPATVRVEARPLHVPGSTAPLDGWLRVGLDGGGQPVAISNNRPSEGLVMEGGAGQPGTAVRETVAVPAGPHALTVASGGVSLLVRLAVERPARPLAALPPPASETVAAWAPGEPLVLAGGSGETAASSESAADRLTALLHRFETRPGEAEAILARAAALAHDNAGDEEVASLWRRFARQSRWQRVEAVERSAGQRTLAVSGPAAEIPALRARTALLSPPPRADEQLLHSGADLVLSLGNPAPIEIEARLELADLPTVRGEALAVRYGLAGGPEDRVALSARQPVAIVRVPVPAGEHELRLALAEPEANRFVRVRLAEVAEGERRPIAREVRRVHEVATAAEPVLVTLEGPAWLRVDEARDGTVLTRYRLVESGWQTVAFAPQAGRPEAWLRLFRLVPAPAAPSPPVAAAGSTGAGPPPPPPSPPAVVADAPPSLPPLDGAPASSGTWSLSAQLERRRAPPDEPAFQGEPDEFLELRGTYRRYDEWRRRYWRFDLLTRGREDGEPTLGLLGRVEQRPSDGPITLFGGFSLFGQALDGEGAEASARGEAGARWRHAFSDRTAQVLEASAFARLLSLTREEARGLDIDADVFTPYKAQHRHGLALSYGLRHRPWLDTLWSADLSLTTNEDFNPADPDLVSFDLEWAQLLGDVVVEAGWRHTHYFPDDDRRRARDTDRFQLSLSWERWTAAGNRLEVGGTVAYRADSAEWSGGQWDKGEVTGRFGLTWHFGAGRGYRDFAPGAVSFEDIRRLGAGYGGVDGGTD